MLGGHTLGFCDLLNYNYRIYNMCLNNANICYLINVHFQHYLKIYEDSKCNTHRNFSLLNKIKQKLDRKLTKFEKIEQNLEALTFFL